MVPCSTESTPECAAALLNHVNMVREQEDFVKLWTNYFCLLAIAALPCFPLHFHFDLSEFSGLIYHCHLQKQDFLGRGANYGRDTSANCLLKMLCAGQPNYFYFTVSLLQ